MVQDKLNPLARRDKPEPLFRRLMLRSFTRLLSKTTSLAEINNVSQKEGGVDLFDFVSSVDTYEMVRLPSAWPTACEMNELLFPHSLNKSLQLTQS